MKKVVSLSAVLAGLSLLAGCASQFPQGVLYTQTSLGLSASGQHGTKVGKACNTSVLGLVATGNASIEAAKRAGGITTVGTVDYTVNNVLGVYGEYCVVIHGN